MNTKDNRAIWEQLFAEVDALEYEKPPKFKQRAFDFDEMLDAAKTKCLEEQERLGITEVVYDPKACQFTFHSLIHIGDFQTVRVQRIINSGVIEGFKSQWELHLNCTTLFFPDTEFVHEIGSLFKGVYGSKKWMDALNLLKYKGFQGVATEYDQGYYGRVLLKGNTDTVAFQAPNLEQAFESFVKAVDNYLEFKGKYG